MTNKIKSKIPYIFFAFFAVVISVNIFYIYISSKTWRGVVAHDSYQKAVKYNDVLDRIKKQNQLNWSFEIKYNPFSTGVGEVVLDLKDKSLNQIRDAKIRIYFRRPTQEGKDFVADLEFKNEKLRFCLRFGLALKGECVHFF